MKKWRHRTWSGYVQRYYWRPWRKELGRCKLLHWCLDQIYFDRQLMLMAGTFSTTMLKETMIYDGQAEDEDLIN